MNQKKGFEMLKYEWFITDVLGEDQIQKVISDSVL